MIQSLEAAAVCSSCWAASLETRAGLAVPTARPQQLRSSQRGRSWTNIPGPADEVFKTAVVRPSESPHTHPYLPTGWEMTTDRVTPPKSFRITVSSLAGNPIKLCWNIAHYEKCSANLKQFAAVRGPPTKWALNCESNDTHIFQLLVTSILFWNSSESNEHQCNFHSYRKGKTNLNQIYFFFLLRNSNIEQDLKATQCIFLKEKWILPGFPTPAVPTSHSACPGTKPVFKNPKLFLLGLQGATPSSPNQLTPKSLLSQGTKQDNPDRDVGTEVALILVSLSCCRVAPCEFKQGLC